MIPPVSGGAGPFARVTTDPLSADALLGRVASPAAGATVVFIGSTRDVAALDYEAYREMAEGRIAEILAGIVSAPGSRERRASTASGRCHSGSRA